MHKKPMQRPDQTVGIYGRIGTYYWFRVFVSSFGDVAAQSAMAGIV